MSIDRIVNNFLGWSDQEHCCGERYKASATGAYGTWHPCRKRPTQQLDNGHWWCGDCKLSPRLKKINPKEQ